MILVRITVQSYTISEKAAFRFVAFVFLYVSKTKKRAEAPFYRAIRLTAKPPPGASVSFKVSPFFTVRFVMVYACGLVS